MLTKPMIDPEFRGIIPSLSDDEYQQLEQNILSEQKCRDAILMWDGVIIDGHNRFYICVKHGIEFEVREMEFESREEVKLWILENQLGRRNLTDAMRIEIALGKAEMLRERAREKQSQAGGDKISPGALLSKSSKANEERINVQKTLAKEAGVSAGTLYSYICVREDGSPALLDKVKSGEIKIGRAYKMLEKEIVKQLKQADKWYAYIKARMPFDRDDELDREINRRLGELEELRVGLLERIKVKKENIEIK